MSQQQKLEKVLDLLLSEDSDRAAELLHQIIVEKARDIYESIVDEEDNAEEDTTELDEEDEVGGEPNKQFTDEISSDEEEIAADELNDGEAGIDMEDEESEDEESEDESEEEETEEVEDRVENLESQLAELRADFDALMGEELQEPHHADLADMMTAGGDSSDDESMGETGDEAELAMYEKKLSKKLKVAEQPMKKPKAGKKAVEEETQFLNKTADTGQRGTAKLVGTGKNTPLGAEDTKAPFTSAPAKKEYGGKPVKIGSGTGGEYGKYHGDTAKDDTITDNLDVQPKKSSIHADTTAKFTGGKAAGEGFTKSPLTKKPA